MNAILPFARIELWNIAGWTMIHYLWLGTLTVAIAAVSRLLLRRASPNKRYVAALGWLAILAALPIGIAALLNESTPALPSANVTQLAADETAQPLVDAQTRPVETGGVDPAIVELSKSSAPLNSPSTATTDTNHAPIQTKNEPAAPFLLARRADWLEMLDSYVKYLPWLWIIGAPFTFLVLATGIVGTKRLHLASRAIHEPQITDTLARLACTLRITTRVGIAVCERIAAPVLIGILRPIILLPPAALTGWTPDEIEMVLLHELAHVRRWDNLVNFAQRIIESLLFFHPAVWFVSTWIRREREACCDAIVVTRTNRPHAYAELLVALAAQMPRSVLFHPAASSAMAAGPLRSRIRRILGLQDDPMLISGKSFALMLTGLLIVAMFASLYLPTNGRAQESVTGDGAAPVNKVNQDSQNDKRFRGPRPKLTSSAIAIPDDLDIKSLFDVKDYNQFVTRGYLIAPWKQELLQSTFETLQTDSYGPKLQFDATWSKEGRHRYVRIRAPEAAHAKLFEPMIRKWVASKASAGSPDNDNISDDESIADLDGSVLADAVAEFNAKAIKDAVGKTQPPLTEQEVIAAIRAWDRDRISVSDEVCNAYQKIAERGVLPPGAMLDYTTGWQANSGYEFDVWWIDLTIPTGPGTGYTFRIRDIKLGSRPWRENQDRLEIGDRAASSRELNKAIEADQINIKHGRVTIHGLKKFQIPSSRGDEAVATDDWPAGVAFPSPKEGEISRRVWQLLGLKLAPVTADDRRLAKSIGDVKIVDGAQLPPGASGPVILNSINQAQTRSFDHVASVLDELENHSGPVLIDCTFTHSEGDRVGLQFAVPILGKTPATHHTKANTGKFPTLEEQKLADLVWRRLQLELEPIGDDDLKRVRSLGYEGGLLVRGNPGVVAKSGADQTGDSILTNDILVGLHVWPTTTMEDVAEVLNRDDLAELNPLKFYVVRNMQVAEKDNEAIMGDALRSGRISVDMIRSQEAAAKNDHGSTVATAQAPPASDPDLPRYELPSPDAEDAKPKLPRRSPSEPAPPNEGIAVDAALGPAPPATTASKNNLYYDGMTFDQWRDLWRNELSATKRREAVRALAAFGSAGYGHQAVDEILDLAGNYDFLISMDAEGQLEKAVLEELTPQSRSHNLAKYWMPDLSARLKEDPEKWYMLVGNLLYRLKTNDPQIIAVIQSLAESGPSQIRIDALSAVVRASISQEGRLAMDEKTRKLLANALSGDDPAMTGVALRLLLYSPHAGGVEFGGGGGGYGAARPKLIFQSELVPLLFHTDEEIRRQSRGVLRYVDKKDAPQVVRHLVGVLEDESRMADHVHAIRGLAAMGAQSRDAMSTLKQILTESTDRKLLLASLAAIERIASDNILYITDGVSIGDGIDQALSRDESDVVKGKLGYADSESHLEFIKAVKQACNAVYPPGNQQLGGGGFF